MPRNKTWGTSKAGFDAGSDTLAFHLDRQGMRVPSTSTIRRIITDAGVVFPQPQKKPRSSCIRFEAAMRNECWQADITHLFLIDGTRVEVLDFIDDHSRYLLSITARAAFSGPAVAAELQRLVDTFGPPASTLTDNGLVSTARLAGRKGGRNAFEKILTDNRIQQKNGRPGHLQTQGKFERFHQTLKRWISRNSPPITTTAQRIHRLLQHRPPPPGIRQTHTEPSLHSPHKSPAQRQPPTRVAHPQRHCVSQRKSHHPLRQQALPPRNRTRLHGARHPRGHHRQPHHNITQKTGEIITEHHIDTSRNYQKPYWRKGGLRVRVCVRDR